MKYPDMKYVDRFTSTTQVKFGGLNKTAGAGDGDICAMKNMSGIHYPVLATRERRYRIGKLEEPGGLVALGQLGWVDGTGFWYGGALRGQVTKGQKVFGVIGSRILIFPDKCWYDTDTQSFGSLESHWEGESLTFGNGLLYGEAADANTISCAGVNWSDWFREGDAVTISGCLIHPENNKTPIIRQIDGDRLYFYENVFKLAGANGLTEYTETGSLAIRRTVPDMIAICENEGRVWGCDGRTVYASKPGDIFNWNVFDGLESDAWTVTPEAAGDNVACFAYKGFTQVFKEDHLYKVYGSYPSNFQMLGSATLGVAEGSGRSLAVAGETLFWLGRNGMVAYTGGIPQNIAEVFGGARYRNGVAGSDGMKYYISMEEIGSGWGLYAYDTRTNLWHQEDETHATHFAKCDGQLYMLTAEGEIWLMGNVQEVPEGAEPEEDFPWMVEFADFTEDSWEKKGVGKLMIRMELEEDASVEVWIQFDCGDWKQIWSATSEGEKRSWYLPVIPRRCDSYRVRIKGTGGARIFTMTREYFRSTPFRSSGRRN